jgi:regulator of replication initiation timing
MIFSIDNRIISEVIKACIHFHNCTIAKVSGCAIVWCRCRGCVAVLKSIAIIQRCHVMSSSERPGMQPKHNSKVLSTISDLFGRYAAESKSGGRRGESPLAARSKAATSALQATELSRLGELWKQAKYDAKEKERELARTRARLLREERKSASRASNAASQAAHSHAVMGDAFAVRQRVRELELNVDALSSENAELRTNYNEALTKLGESLRVLEERAEQQANVTDNARELADRVDTLESEKQSILDTSMANLRAYEEDALQKDRAVAEAQAAQSAAQDAVRSLRQQLDSANESIQQAQEAVARQEAAAAAARRAAVDAKEAMTDMGRSAMDGQGLRTQIRHMLADNRRLVRLLATSKEYRSFAAYTFAEDDTADGGRAAGSYLGVVPMHGSGEEADWLGGAPSGARAPAFDSNGGDRAAWRDIEAYERHYGVDDSQAVEASRELDLWVPSDALRLTIQFRRKHLAHLPTSIIRSFLQTLNAIWRRRYSKQTANLKAKLGATMAGLKRQIKQRTPYREVLQASTIQRLHHQLDALRVAAGGHVVVADHITGLTAPSNPHPAHDSKELSFTRAKRGGSARRSRPRASDLAISRDVAAAPWSDELTFDFPGSADGGGGHGQGWTRRQEAKAVMQHALATVEALASQVSALKAERDELSQALQSDSIADGGAGSVMQQQADVLHGYNQGVQWYGPQAQQLLEACVQAVKQHTAALRRSLVEGKLSHAHDAPRSPGADMSPSAYQEVAQLLQDIEQELLAARSTTRQLLDVAADAGGRYAKYRATVDQQGPAMPEHGEASGEGRYGFPAQLSPAQRKVQSRMSGKPAHATTLGGQARTPAKWALASQSLRSSGDAHGAATRDGGW